MRRALLIVAAAVLATGCGSRQGDADAYGNFEATEVTVSAETAGRILKSNISEGEKVDSGAIIAVIDTSMLILQRSEIDAGISSVATRIASVNAQNEILRQQIANLEVNISRVQDMLKDNAATKKQLDDLTGQEEVLRKQIDANNTQKNSIAAEMNVMSARRQTLNEQLRRSTVISPITGTVTAKYFEQGELTAAGKPLAKVADLSVMKLKVYVSGAMLGEVKTGSKCTVRVDRGKKEYATFEGTVTTVAEKAEFTPKIIQTKEERVTLVYAVTVETPNDGTLKSGMPGEAIFGTEEKR